MQPRPVWRTGVQQLVPPPESQGDVGASTVDPAKGTQLAKASPNRAIWISRAGWALGAVAGGGLNLLVSKFLPKYATGAQPVINITTDVLESTGSLAQSQLTSPLTALLYSQANKGASGPTTAYGQAIGPKFAAECVTAYQARGTVDSFIVGQLAEFTIYMESIERTARLAKEWLIAGDMDSAARLLGGAMFEDWSTWGSVSPEISPRMFELVFATLSPNFGRFDRAALTELQKLATAEAVRLNDNEDKGLVSFSDTVLAGLLTNATPPRLIAPWSPRDVSIGGDIVNNKHVNAGTWVNKLLDTSYDDAVRALGWKDGLKVARLRRKVTKNVTRDVERYEAKTGRAASPDDMWRMFVDSVNAEMGGRAETKAALLSAGAYIGVGVGTGYAANGILHAAPAWAAPGVSNIVYTSFNYLLFVGSFAIDKLKAFGTALGYSGGAKVSLGKALEREVRNEAIRPRTQDSRVDAIQTYFNNFRRVLLEQVTDLASTVRHGDIDEAAESLAGIAIASQMSNYTFHPFLDMMERLYKRVGPAFDGITEAARTELLTKAEARVKAEGMTEEQIAGYYRPFFQSLLTWNVRSVA